jgi:N utilization substance protein B
MYPRSRAREVALQLLFQRDHNPATDRGTVERFARERLKDAASIEYCLSLYDAVTGRAEEIDRLLGEASENWRLTRMAAVDRNVLRLAAVELLNPESGAPAAVAIDEAVELGRRFGSADSPAFVNGVLDKVRKNLETADPR